MYNQFRPGKIWYDVQGRRIQAHGGGLLYIDGTYYWYGENKEGITGMATGEKCLFWHQGVRLYSSLDLYNWTDLGVILVDNENTNSPFHPKNIMDRPHILFNSKTKKFVMWVKASISENTFDDTFFCVAYADNIRGPWTVYGRVENDIPVGDFDLIIDNGKAYCIYEKPHTEMVCAELTEDYLGFNGVRSFHLQRKYPPFVREAPAFFKRGSRRFLLTSGTSGYYPNATELHEIIDFHGEWKDLGAVCKNDKRNDSFHSQFASVYKHPFIEDLYIALGDRWLTDIPHDLDILSIMEGYFNPQAPEIVPYEEFKTYSDENTSEANYVWLPIYFDEKGSPFIVWQNIWKIAKTDVKV